jgi:hypothetical protein
LKQKIFDRNLWKCGSYVDEQDCKVGLMAGMFLSDDAHAPYHNMLAAGMWPG